MLGLVITGLLIDMYPGLRVGPSTVRTNVVLAIFSQFDLRMLFIIENPSFDCWERNTRGCVRIHQ